MFGLILVSGASAVFAASQAFVSTTGKDLNQCTRTQPCRTFAAAIGLVNAEGEIVVLDSGNYGTVLITKAVSLIAPPGVHATINTTSSDAITVAAGANDTVVLRGLTLNGATGGIGINFNSGAALSVENCVINNFFRGILFDSPGKLFVRDTTARKNFVGILIDTTNGISPSAAVYASFERVRAVNNTGTGIFISSTASARVSVTDSIMSGNTTDGFLMSSGKATVTRSTAANNGRHGFGLESGTFAELMLDNCAASGNGETGVLSSGGGGAMLRVSNSVVSDNSIGFGQSGGAVFQSFGNNRVKGNTNNTTGTIQTTGGI